MDVSHRDVLLNAVEFGNDDCVEVLVKAGAKIRGLCAMTAAETGSERCVKLILEAGGDPDDMLLPAIYKRRHNIVELLLREGANANDPDSGERTLLGLAVCLDDITCLKLLLEAGADVNQKNYYGQTALFNAVSERSVQCTDMLLKAGADVNITDNCGRTAFI